MSVDWPLRFGAFLSPIHSVDENPNLALHRDGELICHLDALGFDEAWVGEHHSTGWEYISSPEVFIAWVASRTTRIKLGTGVVSLPYHHPFNVLQRAVLLDHLTRGRLILGMGPGALPYDMVQIGVDPFRTRPMMQEALGVMLALLRGERVTYESDWFQLVDAKLQLLPYTDPCFELAVTASLSPNGARLAGMFGTSMLTTFATQIAGLGSLRTHWEVAEAEAAEHGKTVDRRNWRLAGPMHLAPTEEQARREVEYGLHSWLYYMTQVTGLDLIGGRDWETLQLSDAIDHLTSGGFAVIGTPDQAIAQIERLWDVSGGFGTYLLWSHDWADPPRRGDRTSSLRGT
jgi:limonene 1,2-monooxygenase